MRFCNPSASNCYRINCRGYFYRRISAVLQNKQQNFHKIVDTCGVSNLHGLPGIFGGLCAIVVIDGIDVGAQLKGIAVTIALALISGLISGKIISYFGKSKELYNDVAEFKDAA